MDFPMPGSPPTNTREPATMPLPSTRSSSPKPVPIRSVSSTEISSREDGLILAGRPGPADPADIPRPRAGVFRSAGSSTKVFHALHPGHWPIHFADSYPHSLQKNTVFAFAINTSVTKKLRLQEPSGPLQPCALSYLRITFTVTGVPSFSSTPITSLPLILVFIPPMEAPSTNTSYSQSSSSCRVTWASWLPST